MQKVIESQPKTSLFLGLGRVVQIGYHWNSRMHKHNAVFLVFSREPVSFRLSDGPWQSAKAFIINANLSHELKYPSTPLVSLKIIPLRQRGSLLQKYILKGKSFQCLELSAVEPYVAELLTCAAEDCGNARIFHISEQLQDKLIGLKPLRSVTDQRIISVMSHIQKNIQKHISARELAASVFLSEDRFLHLFKEQTGIPLRQYIIYQRVMVATDAFLNGKTICAAAELAGFSDCAHFSRTFIEINGLKPSDIIKYRDSIYTHICTSTFCFNPLQPAVNEEMDCHNCRFFYNINIPSDLTINSHFIQKE